MFYTCRCRLASVVLHWETLEEINVSRKLQPGVTDMPVAHIQSQLDRILEQQQVYGRNGTLSEWAGMGCSTRRIAITMTAEPLMSLT